ncbi:outer membrane beta-barrel protein [Dyella sp.]|jgi:OOP family OmpA-OmpF porin/outer membrane immunogenic protein|uniref:outer membrane beta-barrel protein n=1 Tax=Dyella sp. TaxID=1869338 RepID=UPI002D79A2D3|nr:outer membrane beta-barrel protein [Dyella sp.]HET6430841.1 outer membrane beta-barrel protein [Dyella sp.]
MKKSLLAIAFVTAGTCSLPVLAQDTMGNDAGTTLTDTDTTGSAPGNYQPSQPVGTGNWFIDGSVGQAHMYKGPFNDHPTTYALNGGYRWKVGPDLGLGVEAGYNDLGNFKVKNAFNSDEVNLTGRRNALRGWTAGVNGRINVWQGLYVSGRAGVYGWKGHGYSDQDINRHDLDQVDYYAGAGVGYDFNDHFGLGLSYDYFHANKDHVNLTTDTASLTAEYRF